MTISKNKRETVDNILELASMTNPWNRQGLNSKSEYYIYQMGFLASYMASLCEEDPYIYRRFKQHCERAFDKKRLRERGSSKP